MLLGDILVVGLEMDDVAQLEMSPRTDHGRGREVEDGGQAADTVLDVVNLEISVSHAQEGGVPFVIASVCHSVVVNIVKCKNHGEPTHSTSRLSIYNTEIMSS